VALLVGVGACFLSGNHRAVRIGVIVGAGLCLADWILIQDFGFFGGVGTAPNSMVPMALVFTSGSVAMVRLPVRAPAAAGTPLAAAAPVGGLPDGSPAGPSTAAGAGWFDRLGPTYLLRSLFAIGAVGILLVGAAPMAVAATDPNADPILIEAANGTPDLVDIPAAPFTLTDTGGRSVSLASLAGRTVVLTFLDPVCTSDCPLIAQELRLTDQMLGGDTGRVELVAVVNNPLYSSTALTAAFDKQEGLDHLVNWTYLTGSLSQLHEVWNDYGVQTQVTPAGAMIAHSDIVYIIDRSGHTRVILNSDPGAGTAAGESSFSALLAGQVRHIAQP
jgi:cytochrome oxidase Cu insertion factor (SCO1/SenC/PrrC family)